MTAIRRQHLFTFTTIIAASVANTTVTNIIGRVRAVCCPASVDLTHMGLADASTDASACVLVEFLNLFIHQELLSYACCMYHRRVG